ncbi:hypothetical protein H5P36_15775 [Bacillus sp. APMAM]|nr:hypothetical protein [Bacillus sp. APMAM]RTZ55027.1 hypothetical protein EKO25_15025 [Bacillus sp. SAJ1]
MEMSRIHMQSTFARIGMETTPSQQSIEQSSADMEIQQPQAQLYIHRTPSVLTIDQSEAWADMDIKPISRRVAEFASKGYSDWLEGLAKTTEEGNELMKIEYHGKAIADISKRNGQLPTYDFNIGFIPRPFSVKINIEPGTLDIQAEINKPNIQVSAHKPNIEYQLGKVNIFMRQYPSLNIDIAI